MYYILRTLLKVEERALFLQQKSEFINLKVHVLSDFQATITNPDERYESCRSSTILLVRIVEFIAYPKNSVVEIL